MATQLQEAVQNFKALQQEMQVHVNTRQQLVAQISETEMVKDELGRLDDDAVVYKQIGPALVKQDLIEANANVRKRLEFIKAELGRVEDRITGLEGRAKEQQAAIMKLQAASQSRAAGVPVS